MTLARATVSAPDEWEGEFTIGPADPTDALVTESQVWIEQGVLVGVPFEVTASDPLPGEGVVITREYPVPLPEEMTATLAYFNEDLGTWHAVLSEVSADRRSVTATVDHLSIWNDFVSGSQKALGEFASAAGSAIRSGVELTKDAFSQAGSALYQGAEELAYGSSKVLTVRVDPPVCPLPQPDWVGNAMYLSGSRNAPLLICHGGSTADEVIARARVNRGFAFTAQVSTDAAWVDNTTHPDGLWEAVLPWLTSTQESFRNAFFAITGPDPDLLVGPGQEISIAFSADAIRGAPDGEPTVYLDDPDAIVFLTSTLAELVMGDLLGKDISMVSAALALASCGDALLSIEDPAAAARAAVTCFQANDDVIARQLAGALAYRNVSGAAIGKGVGRASITLALLGPAMNGIEWGMEKTAEPATREITIQARPQQTAAALTLAPGGRVIVHGTDVSELPYEEAIERISAVLGPPDETTGVGEACETHISMGFAARWKNFRVLTQTEDNPWGGSNARLGRIAGWDLNGWGGERLQPSPTMNGLSLDSTLESARRAYPSAAEDWGDGAVMFGVPGTDEAGGATLYFVHDGPDAPVMFIESGYGCGT
ncbi:MAG: hypothetical protein Q4G67_11875 [Actinomycetia bacterium]|nr:hypothetical protein [Actinomycetes bacterium]